MSQHAINPEIRVTGRRAVEELLRVARETGRPLQAIVNAAVSRGLPLIEKDLRVTDPDRQPLTIEAKAIKEQMP